MGSGGNWQGGLRGKLLAESLVTRTEPIWCEKLLELRVLWWEIPLPLQRVSI